MSTLAVFLLLAGGTAIAAKQLGKKTVGAKQLKSNAVTTKKIKKAAVTKAKIADGAIDATKIADGSVTGTEINAASTPFSQVVARMRNTNAAPFTPGTVYPLGGYTQNAGEVNQFMGNMDVNFPASCEPPRNATAFLLIDAADPAKPTIDNLISYVVVEDKSAGSVTRKASFSPFVSFQPLSKAAPAAATPHSFSFYLAGVTCKAGGGVTAVQAGLDVIGTK